MAKIFYTPAGYSGTAELTVANGLNVTSQGLWLQGGAGYNDGATFGLSLTHPSPLTGGELAVSATDWTIANIGNELSDYTDPVYGFLPADTCRITINGRWMIVRQQNSDSYNSFGCVYSGSTVTDLGSLVLQGQLQPYQSPPAVYVIQGAAVTGGAQDTFSAHEFFCTITEVGSTGNSNKLFQSNSISRPSFAYSYTKSWEIEV